MCDKHLTLVEGNKDPWASTIYLYLYSKREIIAYYIYNTRYVYMIKAVSPW